MKSKKNNLIAVRLSIATVLLASLFTQNRSMLVGLMLFYMAVELIVFKKNFRAVLTISTLAVIVSSLFLFLASSDMVTMLQQRLFLGPNIQSELAHSFGDRYNLYDQYINILEASFPFGQGFGPHYNINRFSGSPVYTTDISLLSFALPFGICGLFIFLGFIVNVLKSFKTYSKYNFVDKSGKVFFWLTISALIVSLNVDLFSRNIFVVYLAVFAVLHDTARKNKAAKTGTAYNGLRLKRSTQDGPAISQNEKE
jgi:hypothetical protein